MSNWISNKIKVMLACLEANLPPNSISWSLFLQIFVGGMPPDPLEGACTPAMLATEHPQLEVPSSSHGKGDAYCITNMNM